MRVIPALDELEHRHARLDLNGWMRLEPGQSKNSEGRMFPLFPELRAVLEAQRERVCESNGRPDRSCRGYSSAAPVRRCATSINAGMPRLARLACLGARFMTSEDLRCAP
jgi:hypothetical protein